MNTTAAACQAVYSSRQWVAGGDSRQPTPLPSSISSAQDPLEVARLGPLLRERRSDQNRVRVSITAGAWARHPQDQRGG